MVKIKPGPGGVTVDVDGSLSDIPEGIETQAQENAKEYQARIDAGEVIDCQICGTTIDEQEGAMLTINEVSHNFTGNWCFQCATGLCSALLQSLPEVHQRAVVRRFVQEDTPSHGDIQSVVASDLASIYGIANPDLIEAFEATDVLGKKQA